MIDLEIIQHMRESSLSSFFVEDPVIPFRAVDETTKIDQVFSEWGPGISGMPAQSSAIQRCGWSGEVHIERSSADAILKSQADTVLLETSLCLRPSSLDPDEFEQALSDIYNQHFKPLPLFQDVVDRFDRYGPYVGVHIRRTDHLRYFRAADISAKNWEKIIRQHVSSAEALYVCSDDEAFVTAVTARLPEYSIVPVDQTLSHTPKFQAFVEFLCLAKAARIYGTVGSGFSKEAARFGGVPFVFCSVKPPDNMWTRVLGRFGICRNQSARDHRAVYRACGCAHEGPDALGDSGGKSCQAGKNIQGHSGAAACVCRDGRYAPQEYSQKARHTAQKDKPANISCLVLEIRYFYYPIYGLLFNHCQSVLIYTYL